MTKINRVTIHGFKSFAQKTNIPFSDNYNCILGPNGSGKSNIGDSLCFVLGRLSAKSMRAEKAANLIFNGGKSKKPAGSGSVEIEFCNKNKIFPLKDKSVTINRTIKKSGSSVYKVNGKKHTRSQVLDLLSVAKINPDGYNIILQGDITRFVTMSPNERRKVIEEISDVSIYEEKKHKAMLELNKVEDKLNSAHIVLKERGTYLKELKKDRDQALKFKGMKDKINSLRATSLHSKMSEKQTEKAKYDKVIGEHEAKIKVSEEKMNALKEKVNVKREETHKINKEIESKGEKQQLSMHRQIEDLKVSMAQHKARVSTLKDEINKIKLRKDQFKQELKDLEHKAKEHTKKSSDHTKFKERKQRELQDLEGKITAFKKKNKIESSAEIEKEIEKIDLVLEKKQEEIQTIRANQQELLREKDRIEYQLQTIEDQIKKVAQVSKENKEKVKRLQKHKTDFKAATLKLNKCLDADSSFASQIANARKNLVEVRDMRDKASAMARSVEVQISGNRAVKSILDKKMKGVHGTIGQLGQVKKKFSGALEAAAGTKMQHIVVENDKIAADCIKHLKTNKLGSAAFIPLNKIRYRSIESADKKHLKSSGVHDFALNLVSYKPKFKNAFQYVFGNSLVVENIDTARKVGIGSIKMATLDGNIAEASGVMRGGFRSQRAGGFAQKDSMEKLQKLEEEVAQLEGVMSNIETKRRANEEEISSLRNMKAELEVEVIKLEKMLHLGSGDLDASAKLKKELIAKEKEVDAQIRAVQTKVSSVNRELATHKSRKHTLRSQISQLRNPRLLAQLSAFEESRQKCREELIRIENEIKNSSMHVNQLIAPEREKINDILKQHEKEEAQFSAEISEKSSVLKKQEAELKEMEKSSKEFYSKYHKLFAAREKLSAEISKAENAIESMREKVRASERETNLVSLRNAEVKAKLAALSEEYEKYKGAKLLKGKPMQEIELEIKRFEVMMSQMSAVNMKALEIYEKVEGEFNKLVETKKELALEKTDVLTLMNEIETKKTAHFMQTFKKADENFRTIFGNLFKKGKAFLQLDNPKKPFDDGLSIKVKLTGNRYMDLKSLSGGEKTLTALSFIFAIQEYQPASFYILDEIDAALDKHNAETLANLIQNYSKGAQYIVISHNDSLISGADTLFGISMNEGVSKVTSLKI